MSQAEGMAGAFRGRLEAEAGGPWQVGAIPLVRQLGAGTESHPQRHHLFRPELLSLGTWGGPKVCMRRGCLLTFLGTFWEEVGSDRLPWGCLAQSGPSGASATMGPSPRAQTWHQNLEGLCCL